jgi:hypothetical protein
VVGHAAGMTGADGVNVKVLISSAFNDYTSMPMVIRTRIVFRMKVNVLKIRLTRVPDKRNRTSRYTGMIPLL